MSAVHSPTVARNSTLPVVGAIVRRSLTRVRRMPSAFLPSLAMPVFQLIAFAGAFAGALAFAGIDSAVDWYVPLAAIQGAAFGAMGLAFAAVNDLQTGFFDRLFMAPAGRNALLYGPLVASMVRALIPLTLVLVIGFIGGAALPGGPLGLVMTAIAALGVAFVAGGFGLGLALRLRSVAAATLTQFAIFFTIFLSTAQMPLDFIEGWVKPLATINPMTRVLAMARQGFLGDVTWGETWPGLLALAIWSTITTLYARRSLIRYDR
jgi:ABC-2 type transport system permease protein